ncbi:MAG: hypothetical protein WBG86_00835, partial [Polyangiales bacterium]
MTNYRKKSSEFDWDQIEPQLPIDFGPQSNGEFFHPADDTDRLIKKVALEMAGDNSKRAGLDRRSFLATSAGLATTLSAINLVTGCGDDSGGAGNGGSGGMGGVGEIACDMDAAREVLDPTKMFLMDVQTHHVDADSEYDAMWQMTNRGYATFFNNFFTGSCPDDPPPHIPCLGRDDFVDLIFQQSDVDIGVLSTFPALTCEQAERIGYPSNSGICGDFLPNAAIADTRDEINAAAGSTRMLAHAAVLPNPSSHLSAADKDRWVQETLRGMENAVNDWGIKAWKCYTPFGPLPNDEIKDLSGNEVLGAILTGGLAAEGWWLDGEYGQAMIEQARALGAPLVNVHKGVPLLSFNPTFGSAQDVGRVATRYSDVTFVIYHSALNFNMASNEGVAEGPYNPEEWGPNDDPVGINSLIHSIVINGLSAEDQGANYVGNVVAELGGPGRRIVTRPDEGTHIIGKLLKYVGENNIVWGTDAIWGGSPQALMQSFMAFEMDEAVAEANGYPMLTDGIKAKIMGLNGARIYGVDVEAQRCTLRQDAFASIRGEYKEGIERRPTPLRPTQVYKGPRTRRDFFKLWAKSP